MFAETVCSESAEGLDSVDDVDRRSFFFSPSVHLPQEEGLGLIGRGLRSLGRGGRVSQKPRKVKGGFWQMRDSLVLVGHFYPELVVHGWRCGAVQQEAPPLCSYLLMGRSVKLMARSART